MTQQSSLTTPLRFTNRALARLLVPLAIEQLLAVAVGMADTMMVSHSGEAAVSGISLVDQIAILLIQVFAALATGGAVVASQYLGRGDKKNAAAAAKQLLWLTTLCAGVLSLVSVAGNRPILQAVFGNIDADVMANAEVYFWITALSYPFLAIYNSGAALFRCLGNSRISLKVSVVMNVINIVGNAILVFGFQMGAAGVAIATLVSRAAAGLIMLVLMCSPGNPLRITRLWNPGFSKTMLRNILGIGIPSGVENGMFQVGKLLVASLIATFGTTAIAANAVCNNIASIANIPGGAVGLSMIAVVGQCVGAKDYQQAKYYVERLMLVSIIGMTTISALLFVGTPLLLQVYALSEETTSLALLVIRYTCVCNVICWVPSFTLPNALRAAGDAKFTMTVSMFSMWLFRVALSYLLGSSLGLGLLGVWIAMTVDWAVRAMFFCARYVSGKWKNANVIDR